MNKIIDEGSIAQEAQQVIERYDRRKITALTQQETSLQYYFSFFARAERELIFLDTLKERFKRIEDLKLLEIGAGAGVNLYFFNRYGVRWENIYANELLSDRVVQMEERFPLINILEGDATAIELPKVKFDLIFQSTVFTSLFDDDYKQKLAKKMWELTSDNGIVLWYDFVYNNPNNKDVKGVGRSEVKALFPQAKKIDFHRVTLAPPIGRKVGKLYPVVNAILPFLRTHLIAVISK